MDYVVSKNYKTGDKVLGKVAFSNLQDCFNNVNPGDRIFLCDELYYGKHILRCKDITIIGSDESVISYDAYHGEKIRECDGGDGYKVYGTTGSATFTVTPMASNLRMVNVTVQNTHMHVSIDDQAVAFKSEAEGGFFEECKFISCQDTLYITGNDNILYKCYIYGTVDFIMGSGNVIYDRCKIVLRCKDNKFTYITAPNTNSVNNYGFYFYKCSISTDGGGADNYLGRPWYSTGAKFEIIPRAFFYKCSFPKELKLEAVKMRDYNPDNFEFNWFECEQQGELKTKVNDQRLVDFYEKIYLQRR